MTEEAKKSITFGKGCTILKETADIVGNLLEDVGFDYDEVEKAILSEKNKDVKEEFVKAETIDSKELFDYTVGVVKEKVQEAAEAGKLTEKQDLALWDNGFYEIANGTVTVNEPTVTKEMFSLNKESITDLKNATVFQISKAILETESGVKGIKDTFKPKNPKQ